VLRKRRKCGTLGRKKKVAQALRETISIKSLMSSNQRRDGTRFKGERRAVCGEKKGALFRGSLSEAEGKGRG